MAVKHGSLSLALERRTKIAVRETLIYSVEVIDLEARVQKVGVTNCCTRGTRVFYQGASDWQAELLARHLATCSTQIACTNVPSK